MIQVQTCIHPSIRPAVYSLKDLSAFRAVNQIVSRATQKRLIGDIKIPKLSNGNNNKTNSDNWNVNQREIYNKCN